MNLELLMALGICAQQNHLTLQKPSLWGFPSCSFHQGWAAGRTTVLTQNPVTVYRGAQAPWKLQLFPPQVNSDPQMNSHPEHRLY